jgi:hypothetical protein
MKRMLCCIAILGLALCAAPVSAIDEDSIVPETPVTMLVDEEYGPDGPDTTHVTDAEYKWHGAYEDSELPHSKYDSKVGYVNSDATLDPPPPGIYTKHDRYHLGPGRRRVGTGFGRRRRAPYVAKKGDKTPKEEVAKLTTLKKLTDGPDTKKSTKKDDDKRDVFKGDKAAWDKAQAEAKAPPKLKAKPVCKISYTKKANFVYPKVISSKWNYTSLAPAQAKCTTLPNCVGVTKDNNGYNLRDVSHKGHGWKGFNSWQRVKSCLREASA